MNHNQTEPNWIETWQKLITLMDNSIEELLGSRALAFQSAQQPIQFDLFIAT